MTRSEEFIALGEAGWRWVLDQVRWADDGPWIAAHAESDEDAGLGMYDGIGGLAHVLAEIRLGRAWTEEETRLADGIIIRVTAATQTREDASWFKGLASDIGALEALDAPGSQDALARLIELSVPHGWTQHWWEEGGPDLVLNDLLGGTTGVLLAALWSSGDQAREVAEHAVDALLAQTEDTPDGPTWPIIGRAQRPDFLPEMPNFSHGAAGSAAALAVAGRMFGRTDLIENARRAAERLVAIGDTTHGGFTVPHYVPHPSERDDEPVTYTWCHGPTGTSYLFAALELAGVTDVAGETPAQWHRRCLTSVVNSGLPMRIRPGFWDNDGRCCGTAGVGEAFLDSYQRLGDPYDLAFCETLGLALQERAYAEDGRAWWRFVEHRKDDPLLPAGIGWMQGTAGIAAYLLRLGRVLRDGQGAKAPERMETWWALPRD